MDTPIDAESDRPAVVDTVADPTEPDQRHCWIIRILIRLDDGYLSCLKNNVTCSIASLRGHQPAALEMLGEKLVDRGEFAKSMPMPWARDHARRMAGQIFMS